MESLSQYVNKRWKHYLTHETMRNDPIATLTRTVSWFLHCLIKKPGIAKLKPWNVSLYLPAKFRRVGSTMIYIAREYYEPELLILNKLLSPGDVFIDGGANLGVFTAVASSIVGESGRVLAFEPAEESYSLLEKNAALNKQNNVSLYPIALSNLIGETKLHHIDNAPTSYSLGGDPEAADEFETIKTTTLDKVVEDNHIHKIDVLKLDVEGAEELVLEGARASLEKFMPIVIFEIRKLATDRMDLDRYGAWNILEDMDYELYKVRSRTNDLVKLESPPSDGNYVAIPPGNSFP